MNTFVRRAIDAHNTANRWLTVRPHVMVLVLAAFAVLFAGYWAYDYLIGNTGMAAMAAMCAALAGAGAVFEAVRLRLRKDISAGQGA